MRILGIDPGIATVGFGVVDVNRGAFAEVTHGVITTPAKVPLTRRLDSIYGDLTTLISDLKPDAISIEELFFAANVKTGISVAHGRGVILLACFRSGIPAYEYTPLQVKQSVAGYGLADKHQVQEMVKRLLNLTRIPRPDDAADALAIALCHARASTSLMFTEEPI
ncbi:MAG: crossover junction endodeoxyribonuclease RuvC [Oscillospiraceae bacterium]|jgi:crossover junction endodeoxyribonuclease RuvC|nr:crossover junction endodeoxyribonuclease RuvC [Oscillospiraceae bacterium]